MRSRINSISNDNFLSGAFLIRDESSDVIRVHILLVGIFTSEKKCSIFCPAGGR